MTPGGPLWSPSPARRARAALTAFRRLAAARGAPAGEDYAALHAWSIDRPEAFWGAVWDFCGVRGERPPGGAVLEDGERMPGARWFPGARLSFAENLLAGPADRLAILALDEQGRRRELSLGDLRARVGAVAAALARLGVGPGDRVAGFVANVPEAVVAMLAAASLGATWSSCSPDFGPRAVLDRLGQLAPKVLLATCRYHYAGKAFDTREKIAEIVRGLPSLRAVWLADAAEGEGAAPLGEPLEAVLAAHRGAPRPGTRFPFDHPLYVLFSSGTTGPPKAIVHGQGGTLLQHLKEHRLHCDVRPGDRVLYVTTCGWMMWNWLVSALASGAAIVLYDGAPTHPGPTALFDLVERERITLFGASARYLDALRRAGVRPADTHDLSALRTLTSTGSPLSAESFVWVYEAVKRDLHLASISGGTDIVSCFVLGDPTGPVWPGEIQVAGLGMAVDVFDEAGRPVRDAPGELVCTRPFPSMPLGFLDDQDGRRYRAAYFEHYPGVWRHGDLAEVTEHGGYVIHGRSDATLNPSGVRIGTAEIYRQLEAFPEIEDAVAVGQEWEGDVRIVLFVKLRAGLRLDDGLVERVRAHLRAQASPRHVPARVLQVSDVPRTRSGKVSEIAVREAIHGRPVRNESALENPECLAEFAGRAELGR